MNNEYSPDDFVTEYAIIVHFDHKTNKTGLNFGKYVDGELKFFHELHGDEARRLHEESKQWPNDSVDIEIDKLARKYDPEVEKDG